MNSLYEIEKFWRWNRLGRKEGMFEKKFREFYELFLLLEIFVDDCN